MKIRRSAPERRTLDNIVFDSIDEMKRYSDLKLLARAGEIEKLQYQPKFQIEVSGVAICSYSPDFTYIDKKTQRVKVEDVKGWKRSKKTGKLLPRVDREFHIKVKLMKAIFGLEVELV